MPTTKCNPCRAKGMTRIEFYVWPDQKQQAVERANHRQQTVAGMMNTLLNRELDKPSQSTNQLIMNTQPADKPCDHIGMLVNADVAALLQTTLFVEDIDNIEDGNVGCLPKKIELRQALYEVARQNARHRLTMAGSPPLPAQHDKERIDLMVPDTMMEVLKTTLDVRDVDQIEEFTNYRLNKQPVFRKNLFVIARQGVAYRLATRQQTEPVA